MFSVTPMSRNVSEGKTVEFSCVTSDSGVSLSWSTLPNIETNDSVDTPLPGGGIQSVLSFTATAQHNNVFIICSAFRFPDVDQSAALLSVQGKIL